MKLFSLLIAILGLSDNSVLMINQTGLKIVRIEIDNRKFEEVEGKAEQILINITPEKHNMTVVFKGGGDIHWPDFDFHGVHEVIFYRFHHHIKAHAE